MARWVTSAPILGVAPMLGRWFNRADVAPNAADTVMLDYGYWQRRFGSDRAIVGHTITVDGKARQVIGVMPQHFRFLDGEQPQLFLPLQLDRGKTTLGQFSYEGGSQSGGFVTQWLPSGDAGSSNSVTTLLIRESQLGAAGPELLQLRGAVGQQLGGPFGFGENAVAQPPLMPKVPEGLALQALAIRAGGG